MNCYKVSKLFIFLVMSFSCSNFLQASIATENNSKKRAEINDQVQEELLTDEKLGAMYKAYANKELTCEEVAFKIERDKQVRMMINEIRQGLKEVKITLEALQKDLK